MPAAIHRTLVHQQDQRAVLLSSAARYPGRHWLFTVPCAGAGRPCPDRDILAAAEALRQGAIALAHLDDHAPLGWALLLRELNFSFAPAAAHLPPATQAQLTVRVHAARHGHRLSDLQLRAELSRGPILLGTGHADLSFLPPAFYRTIRPGAPRADHAGTGSADRVLAQVRRRGDTLQAQLVWNRQDRPAAPLPTHLPDMLAARAMLEAHTTLTGTPASALALHCAVFGEFSALPVVTAFAPDDRHTRTTVTGNGRILATGRCGTGTGEGAGTPGGPRFLRTLT